MVGQLKEAEFVVDDLLRGGEGVYQGEMDTGKPNGQGQGDEADLNGDSMDIDFA